MTHFQKVDPSFADKTLNEAVTSWESVNWHTHKLSILSNHNQLCVGLIVMELY